MDVIPHGWEVRHFGQADRGYSALIGPLLARQDGERWVYGVQIEERHLNVRGAVHGGMIASLADHSLGMIVWEHIGREPCVTVELNVKYVSAGKLGDLLTVRGEVVRATRSVVFVRGLMMAGERVVAMADGVWKRLGSG
jgi:uncharacterized protein (TIGR00369 family)